MIPISPALLALPWRKIIRVGLIIAGLIAIFGTPYYFGRKHGAAKAEAKLEAQAAKYELKLEARDLVIDRMRAKAIENGKKRAELERLYQAATSTPPEVVVRYRDRIREIPAVITSPDCCEAITQGRLFVRELAALEKGRTQ
jgi:superfamily II DNA or RNA helicase